MAHRSHMSKAKTDFARELRRKPTKAQALLWQELRRNQLAGVKFRRQAPMAGYIVDFYAPQLKLIIEVNKSLNRDRSDEEVHRDQVLESLGYRLLRFSEHQVETNVDSVCDQISAASLQ